MKKTTASVPRYCYFNGKIIPVSHAKVSVTDIGLLRGYAIFDFGKIYGGVTFLLKEHIERFKNSARKMNLKIPVSDRELIRIVDRLLIKNKMRDANVRFVLTGGQTVNGLQFKPGHGTFFILLEESKSLPSDIYENGAKLITHNHQRAFSDIKTTNYLTAVSLQGRKDKEKALEILFTFNNKVLECTTSNFFIFKKHTLITSKDDILIGITRNFVLKLAREAGFRVQERVLKISELAHADEAFITASNKEIVPIVNIDGRKIGSGVVGPHTKKLTEMLQKEILSMIDRGTSKR